jgi:hypothetical protein
MSSLKSRTQLRNGRKRAAQKKRAEEATTSFPVDHEEEEEKKEDPAAKLYVCPGRLNANWDDKKKAVL